MGWILGLGNGVVFRTGSSQSWSSYWLTRYISALSVLTTSDTEQTVTATIVGTGYDGVSFEYSTDFETWTVKGTSITGTYNATGLTQGTVYYWRARLYKGSNYGSYSPTAYDLTTINTLLGSNSVLWADCMDDDFITKDGSNLVAEISDKLGGDNDLLQSTDTNKPTWSKGGITFDGVDNFMKTNDFIYNQPEHIYLLFRHITYSAAPILDGDADNSGNLIQFDNPGSGRIIRMKIYGGTTWSAVVSMEIGEYAILKMLFNGAASKFQKNLETAVTGNFGAANMGAITIGRYGAFAAYGNFKLKEGIFRSVADSAPDETIIYNYIVRKHTVWNPQGTVLNATIAAEEDNICEPFIMYEGNAQILATTGDVFKLWFTGGWDNPSCWYAESLDGKTWTKHPTAVIVGSRCADLIKVGSVYHLYNANVATTAFNHYTSTDGINWTLVNANILTVGASGAWDDLTIANKSIIIKDGTWYMFYEGNPSGAYDIGLATSDDGITWTKYGSAAVINVDYDVSGPDVHLINGTYYMWTHGTRSTAVLPTDIAYRYKSTDLLTWVRDTDDFSLTRKTADEGYGTAVGQLADSRLIEVNGRVYLFHSASADGSQQAGKLHIKLAIANMSFEQLVQREEGCLLPGVA